MEFYLFYLFGNKIETTFRVGYVIFLNDYGDVSSTVWEMTVEGITSLVTYGFFPHCTPLLTHFDKNDPPFH